MVFEPAAEAEEALSPELVLVATPEVAQRARERLPERPGIAPPVAPVSPAFVERVWLPEYPRIAIEDLLPDPPRRRKRGLVVLAVCLLAVVASAGYLAQTQWHGSGAARAARVVAAPVTPAAPTKRSPAVPTPRAPKKQSPGVPPPRVGPAQKKTPRKTATPRPVTVTQPAPTSTDNATKRALPAAKPKPQSPPPAAPAGAALGFVPGRTWAWAPSPSAGGYDVAFFLDGRLVLRARPKEPHLVLPSSFRYRAGHYRWTVRASGTAGTTEPIVDGKFVLTAAAAAAANSS